MSFKLVLKLKLTLRKIRAAVSTNSTTKVKSGGWAFDDAKVYDRAWVSGYARLRSDAKVYGNASVR